MKSRRPKPKYNLDIGCGEHPQPGFVGMDKRPLPGVEIVHDAEVFPWPIQDGIADVIMMSHFVEHVKPWVTVDLLNEAWRVLKPEGLLLIATPYGGSFRYVQDPTHCNPWNEATVQYFIAGMPLYDIYRPRPWKLEKLTWFVHGDLEAALRKMDENGNPGS